MLKVVIYGILIAILSIVHFISSIQLTVKRRNLLPSMALVLMAVTGWSQPGQSGIGILEFRDVYEIPNGFQFQGTPVGGLSGIDYDPTAGIYYIICDDRSALQPARFYKVNIAVSAARIDTVTFTDKIDLVTKDGKTYPKNSLDPEGMCLNPATKDLVWLSEGERIVSGRDTTLIDPGIFVTKEGKYISEYPIAPEVRMTSGAKGARQNGSFEALSFSDNGRNLWVALEEPLYQDGPRADVEDSRALVRFYKYDASTRKNTAQYAYDLEPVAYTPILPTAFRVNGVTDILDAGNNEFIVLERSFSTGRLPCTIKIFLADMKSATDVRDIPALIDNTTIKPATKRLLLDMDTIGKYVDNVEGITWGPLLTNGNRTLLLVTDNNFQSFQKTQIFLIEVISK